MDRNAKRGNAAISRYCVKSPDLIIIYYLLLYILLLSLWLHHKKGMHIEHLWSSTVMNDKSRLVAKSMPLNPVKVHGKF